MNNTFKAKVVGSQSKPMTKANGAIYVLMNCQILEGPAKGLIVAGTRTIVNAEGEDKEIPSMGDEVILYRSVLPSTKEEGKYVNFFEISLGNITASNEMINELLGVSSEVATTTPAQGV